MHVIRKMSQFFRGASSQPIPLLKKKQSSFKPATRLEKIRQKDFIYPLSTPQKYIFIANLDGSGFQRQSFPYCPLYLTLSRMVNQINIVCFKQWQSNREYYKRHPFEKLDLFSNLSLIIAFCLAIILLILVNSGDVDTISDYLDVFLCFLGTSLIICLIVYFTKVPSYNADAYMISCIKNKLSEFNQQEISERNNQPQFIWTSHKDCIWIAFRILDIAQKVDQ